jgi:hypothetical protein
MANKAVRAKVLRKKKKAQTLKAEGGPKGLPASFWKPST